MIKKANYKPTLPIFGERFLGEKVKSVRFEEEYGTQQQQQQYDSLYDDNMKDYFDRPKIKKRLFKLGVTDSNGNAIGNKGQERNAVKKKQLLKEREEIVKKIRTREADRITRLAASSNKLTKSCVACETHNRILSYLRNHMCPIHSNVTYQRAKDTLQTAVSHDVLSNEDNLAKLEVENNTLKNLWYSEVLRMEEETLQQQLKYEKRRLQQVLSELKMLKQQKEATDMENLEEIKINLYSKIKRRLGLQALLTTLREVEDGVNSSLFDKDGQDVDTDIYDQSPLPQLNRLGVSFQYLPPPPSQRFTDNVRPSSAPVSRSQQAMDNSELSLHQSSSKHDEQLKKRPSSSRGYRATDNRGPYSRTMSGSKQTANISPLVNSTSAIAGIPLQFSNTLRSNSSLVNEPPINKEDVDDDTMPLDEETVLEGLSDIEASSPLSIITSDEPITDRDKIRRRQAYSVTSASVLNPRPTIPIHHSTPSIAKMKQASEKRVNFMIDSALQSSESQVGSMIAEIIQKAKQQCETLQDDEATEATDGIQDINAVITTDDKGEKSADTIDDPSKTGADIAEKENDPNSISDPENVPNEIITKINDNQNSHQPQTIGHLTTNADDSSPKEANIDLIAKETIDTDPVMEESVGKIVTPPADKPITSKKQSKLLLKQLSSIVPGKAGKTAQAKKVKNSSSAKKLVSKSSKQFDSATKAKQSTKQGVKQTSKKPNKMDQDWKKTILQKVKK